MRSTLGANQPVSAVPNVDFPMIRVSATRPGADPSVMASTVAAPLERRLGQTGMRILTRLMGLVLAAIAVQFIIDGIKLSFRDFHPMG